MLSISLIALLVLPTLLIVAALYDLTTMTIPNWLNALIAVSFPVMALYTGLDITTVLVHLGAGLALLVVGFTFFALRWIGGGDAKLFAALGLWLGFDTMPSFILVTAFFGGVLTIAILGYRHMPLPVVIGKQDWLIRLHDSNEGVPYGIALAAAGLYLYRDLSIYAEIAKPILG